MYYFKNIRLYTGEESFENGAVLTDGSLIVYAGDEKGCPAHEGAEVIDGRGGICMPGLVSAHSHAPMVLLRGEGADLPLMEWLGCVQKMEENFTSETIYTGTALAIAEMIKGGVTAFADMYFECRDMIRAVLDTGIRASISRGSTSLEGIASHEALFREFDGADGRVRVLVGLHGEYTSDEKTARAAAELAAKLGTGVHVHMSESISEVEGCVSRHGVTPPEYFERIGLFDVPVTAAHCVHLTNEDIDIIARHGVIPVHCPASNMYLASGAAPVNELLSRGIPVALGTDGAASNNTLDMFREMRLAALLSKVKTMRADALPARTAVEMATKNAAKAAGFPEVGILAAGRPADLILLDGEALHLNACDIPTAVVYSASGADVKLTMVDGRALFRDGEYTTVDIERLRYEGRRASAHLRGSQN